LLRTDIIELREEFALIDLSTGKLLSCYKVLKVLVVYKNNDKVTSALEFSLLRLERTDYYKEFFVVDLIVILSRVEFPAHKSNRV